MRGISSFGDLSRGPESAPLISGAYYLQFPQNVVSGAWVSALLGGQRQNRDSPTSFLYQCDKHGRDGHAGAGPLSPRRRRGEISLQAAVALSGDVT